MNIILALIFLAVSIFGLKAMLDDLRKEEER